MYMGSVQQRNRSRDCLKFESVIEGITYREARGGRTNRSPREQVIETKDKNEDPNADRVEGSKDVKHHNLPGSDLTLLLTKPKM